ncbi:uncharacterized protein [Gossypium hirsutum]|uniref:Uncharacterized protein n=1 Tax=Gossypium hirsutum TaxID=3635 RepID=A0ABM3BWG5_GOSHI|nr:uncharacterized protein LOC121230554 [Gossypium hirsutum]
MNSRAQPPILKRTESCLLSLPPLFLSVDHVLHRPPYHHRTRWPTKRRDGLLSLILRHIRRPCLLNPKEIERNVPLSPVRLRRLEKRSPAMSPWEDQGNGTGAGGGAAMAASGRG